MDTLTIQKGTHSPILTVDIETHKDGTKVLRCSVKRNPFAMENFKTILDQTACVRITKCIESSYSTKIHWKKDWHIVILPFHPLILFPTEGAREFIAIDFDALEWDEFVERVSEVADQNLTTKRKREKLAERKFQPSMFDITFSTWLYDNGWTDLRYEGYIISEYWGSIASDDMVNATYENIGKNTRQEY